MNHRVSKCSMNRGTRASGMVNKLVLNILKTCRFGGRNFSVVQTIGSLSLESVWHHLHSCNFMSSAANIEVPVIS